MQEPKSRRQRKAFALPVAHHPCCVCGTSDLRALCDVVLASGETVSLCGTHETMARRDGRPFASASDLVAAFRERRGSDRRGGVGEVDELAERLSAAFVRDRRATERRAS